MKRGSVVNKSEWNVSEKRGNKDSSKYDDTKHSDR